MKKKNIRVWVKEPRKPAELKMMPNTLKALQETVGGYIETVTLFDDAVFICDEEGLLKNTPFNFRLCGHFFFGTVIFAGVYGDEFCDHPMQDEDEMKLMFPELFKVGEKK